MNLTTIDLDPEEAAERFHEYERSLRNDRNAEDQAIAMGYRALARGLPVIQLSRCMDAGGWFPNGLPRLAIVRADAERCFVSTGSTFNGRCNLAFTDARHVDNRGALVGRHVVNTSQLPPSYTHNQRWRGETIVPLVPPRFRPRRPRLAHCHILWEVEDWAAVAPVDPALVRHIRGDLWAVLATWDLTELERAVLAARIP